MYDYLLTISHLHFPAVFYFVSLFETQDRAGKATLALIVPVTQNHFYKYGSVQRNASEFDVHRENAL